MRCLWTSWNTNEFQSRATVVPCAAFILVSICHVHVLCMTVIYIYTIISYWSCQEKNLLEKKLIDNLGYLAVTLVFSKTWILMHLGSGWRAIIRRGFLQVCVGMCMFPERKGVIFSILWSSGSEVGRAVLFGFYIHQYFLYIVFYSDIILTLLISLSYRIWNCVSKSLLSWIVYSAYFGISGCSQWGEEGKIGKEIELKSEEWEDPIEWYRVWKTRERF